MLEDSPIEVSVGPSENEIALQKLTAELQRELENRIGFRVSLLTVNVEKKEFEVFHLPSTRINLIEYAKEKASELYLEYTGDIERLIN